MNMYSEIHALVKKDSTDVLPDDENFNIMKKCYALLPNIVCFAV